MPVGEGIKNIINSKSKTFLAFCFCFIAGTAIASFAEPDKHWAIYIYCMALIAIVLAVWSWRRSFWRFVLFAVAIFFCACWRYCVALPDDNLAGVNLIFSATVSAEPKLIDAQTEYILESAAINKKISIKLPAYPAYNFGDILQVSCYLDKPTVSPGSDFQYDKYLLTRGVGYVCLGPDAKLIGYRKSFFGYIYRLKSIVSAKAAMLWSEPESSLIGGLLYGDNTTLPKEVADNFSRVGISHIIAVSGYNISIIAAALMSALILAGLYRRQAFWVAVTGILIFVIFAGAPASAVRAGLMGTVVLVGQYLGRPSRAFPALIFAATLMILANPFTLVWDIGFQLSFVATAGILFLTRGASTVKTTLAAITATLPLILYHFGRLSIVALPVNLLVLWLIPYLMFFGFISLMAGFVIYPVAQMLAWLTGFGLKYILIIAEAVGRQSWASVAMPVPWWLMCLAYIGLYKFYLWQNKK